jgi:hypothetical protein
VHFSFDGTSAGRDIHTEISRRLNHGTWLSSIRVPALTLEQIEERSYSRQPEPTTVMIETQTLKPYDKRSVLVDKIAEGYTVTLYSPPTSPPGSPSKSYSQPILAQVTRMPSFSAPRPAKNNNLPARIKEALLADWTREATISATTKSETSRSGSTQGSSSPTMNTNASKHLAVGVTLANGVTTNGDGIPSPQKKHHSHRHSSRPASGAYGFVPQGFGPGFSMREALSVHGRPHSRRSRRASQSPTPYSTTSSLRSTVRVDELKKVLGGEPLQHPLRGEQEIADNDGNETGSESMVSYEGSELSFVPSANAAGAPGVTIADYTGELGDDDGGAEGVRGDAITEGTITPRPLSASTVLNRKPSTDNLKRKASVGSQGSEQDDDYIPPVPPLPASLRSPTVGDSRSLLPDRTASVASKKAHSLRSLSSIRERDRPRTSHSVTSRNNRNSTMTTSSRIWNARDLLDDIDADSPGVLGIGSRGVSVLGGKPPY